MVQFKRVNIVLLFLFWTCSLVAMWMMTLNGYHFAGNIVITYFSVWGMIIIFSKGSKTKKIIPFILINFSIIAIVVLFESLALIKVVDFRVVFSTPITQPIRNPNYELDSELIFKHKPNTHIKEEYKGGDLSPLYNVPDPHTYKYDVKIDTNGFRNRTDLETAEIVVLGDSFIEGAAVSSHNLITSRLAELQNKSVVNLGIPHYGPQQELIVLRRYALPLDPGIIIWAFYEGNDLRDIYEYKEVIKNLNNIYKSSHSLLNRSFTRNVFLALARLFGNFKPSAMNRSGIVKIFEKKEERIYFLWGGEPLSDSDLSALEETASILTEAYNLTSKERIKLIVVFIPTKFRVYNDIVECEKNSECSNWVVNDLPGRFRKMVSDISHEIGYIDLTPGLIESAKAGEGPYFIDDSHWSPEGHHVAARAIHEYISKKPEEISKQKKTRMDLKAETLF